MHITDLIIKERDLTDLNELHLDELTNTQVNQFIKESYYTNEFLKYDLPVNHKILLYGASGCGKTATAKAIAKSLGRDLLVLNLSNVICARMGETAQNIKLVFDKAAREKSILFLDEFDQIAKLRSLDDKDVGEMRRLVTSIIQLMDYYPKDAILICATNHLSFIDPAILRRFQVKLGFALPSKAVLDVYYNRLLCKYPPQLQSIERVYEVSFAEARDYTFNAVKALLMVEIENRNATVTL